MSRWGELIPHSEDDRACLCGCLDDEPTTGREVTRYAKPVLIRQASGQWLVRARPGEIVGRIDLHVSGWTATTATGAYAGLRPTKQAAAEVLVKQAGYELDRS